MHKVVDKSIKLSLQLSRPVVPSSNQFFIGSTCGLAFSNSPFQEQITGQLGIFASGCPGSVNYKDTYERLLTVTCQACHTCVTTWIEASVLVTPLHLMDKTKSRLAAFFDNDEDDSSFPVRRIELLLSFLPRSPFLPAIAKDRGRPEALSVCPGHREKVKKRKRERGRRCQTENGRGTCR